MGKLKKNRHLICPGKRMVVHLIFTACFLSLKDSLNGVGRLGLRSDN